MSIWIDPILPKLATPTYEVLKQNPVRFGQHEAIMSPNQWEFTFCNELAPGWCGGVRSGKSIGGVYRTLRFTLWVPNNKFIVGRLTQTDLQETTQADFNDYAEKTGLIKKQNDRRTVLYCCDPVSGKVLPGKPTSEVLFQHLDNPNHLKGHGIGGFWIDEGSEVDPKAFYRLTDRLSHPAAAGRYTGFLTTNPEGRNWIWNHWYNPENVQSLTREARLMRRGIHNRTKDNPFLTEEYLRMQYATSPAEWIRRYMDGEFDVFEGQIYKEFSHDIHCVQSRDCKGFGGGEPPKTWPRYLGIDTGGTDPWAFEFSAVDPYGNIIFYDEIYRPENYTGAFKEDLFGGNGKPNRMEGRNFAKIPMDYENKAAMEELRHMGVRVTNAVKHDKREGAINKISRYLHPNPERGFPDWHPRAGQPGSPGIFFTEKAKKLIEELPQQRWKEVSGIAVNQPDDRQPDHATSGAYYIIRERPEPQALMKTPLQIIEASEIDARSKEYWKRVQETTKTKGDSSRGRGILPPVSRRERVWIN